MKVKFLGTGTSTGNPQIGCTCKVCSSKDIKDRRFRASVLIDIDGTRILIDCGPDFRQQILAESFKPFNGVLITHEHYDHVGGLDDLRPFCIFGDVQLYLEEYVANELKKRIPYCFGENLYPGVPKFSLNEINHNNSFTINNIKIEPIRLLHYKLPILGYRINRFAYLTDFKTIPEEEYLKLEDLDILVVDALRIEEHISHENLAQALKQIERIKPKKAYLIHMSHDMGLHDEVQKSLPENVFLSYDGLQINVD